MSVANVFDSKFGDLNMSDIFEDIIDSEVNRLNTYAEAVSPEMGAEGASDDLANAYFYNVRDRMCGVADILPSYRFLDNRLALKTLAYIHQGNNILALDESASVENEACVARALEALAYNTQLQDVPSLVDSARVLYENDPRFMALLEKVISEPSHYSSLEQ